MDSVKSPHQTAESLSYVVLEIGIYHSQEANHIWYHRKGKEQSKMKEELLKGLTEEQITRVKACKNAEEMLSVAKEQGVQLSDEQLQAVSGGGCSGTSTKLKEGKLLCPYCHSDDTCTTYKANSCYYYCFRCNKTFDYPLGR